jgi:hypothetical protein
MAFPYHPYSHILSPALTPARESPADRADRLVRVPQRCLDAIVIAAQSERGREGYAFDLRWCAGLCRATWNEEALWNGLVHVQRGAMDHTHLMFAAMRGDAVRVRWLLARLAPPDLYDKNGDTACIWAARMGHVEVVRSLIAANADIIDADDNGWTALHSACVGGHVDVVRVLLSSGADANAVWLTDASTPLHLAAVDGHVDVIRELLAAGADATLVDSSGRTARRLIDIRLPTCAWPAP